MIRRLAAAAVLGGAVALLGQSCPARAAELRVGLPDATTSLDPLFYVAGSNTQIALNIYDSLMRQDARQKLVPALATAWVPLDDITWDVTLRADVTFQDGTKFGPEDVIASIRHAATVQGSASSFKPYTAGIADMQVAGPGHVRIRTKAPWPLLPNDLSRISIIPRAQQDAPQSDFDGDKVVGTGPFRLVSWQRGASVVVARNPAYWGGAPAWEKVTFRSIADPGARVAALLAGDVDVIAAVPSDAQATVAAGRQAQVVGTEGNRLIYLHLDSNREVTPFARDAAGQPLPHNPLKDARVRRALSLALNRTALVERVMSGQGSPAGQFMPAGYFGYDPTIPAPAYDVAQARKLLAEAGYPDGFFLTLHGPNDRYPNDAKLLQAIAQQFTRIGVKTAVDALPGASFFTRASKLEFSAIMGGAAIETGEPTGILNPLLATYDAAKGAGTGNRGRWSNAQFDALLAQAYRTFDNPAREALLQQASRVAVQDVGVIPVLFLEQSWGLRHGFTYAPRSDGYTLAIDVKAAK
ncbi:ABC transporter substrate-binding protein [Limobrevibacterium gyesilva]|uniref:ABC transporter substrate-binding protein n=1 Tax=Limobrevibacterium gyesilva TaxID=2991712 RepID=A0AA42CI16_9PROT|nr:ABC transporter substrate-binding protein [Limobrevibacterium gyesilva]MCW3477871.1 ABC transporter substrate-binding protein [Limobrevibacterium gyesilva]